MSITAALESMTETEDKQEVRNLHECESENYAQSSSSRSPHHWH